MAPPKTAPPKTAPPPVGSEHQHATAENGYGNERNEPQDENI